MKSPFFHLSILLFFLFHSSLTWGQAGLIDSLNQVAYESYRENVVESKKMAIQALRLSQEQELSPQLVDSYINMSRCFRMEGKLDSAFYALRKALKIGKDNEYSKGLMNANNNLAICFLSDSESDSALIYFQLALQYAIKLEDAKGQANAYNNLAIIAQQEQKNDSAIKYLDGALSVYEKMGDSSGVSRVYINQAFIYDITEQNNLAIEYNFKALKIQEDLGLTFQQMSTLNQIGDLYTEKEKHAQALIHYQKALTIAEKIGDQEGITQSYINVGGSLDEQNKSEEALPYLKKGLLEARKLGNPYFTGGALLNLGTWYLSQKDSLDKAGPFFREAIPYLETAEAISLPSAYNKMGRLTYEAGKYTQSNTWFKKGLETAREYQDLKSQEYALKHLAYISSEKNQFKLSLEYSRGYHALKDCLINLKSLEKINELNIEYESAKKEKENLELQNDLTQSELEATRQKVLRNQLLGIASFLLLLGLGGFLWFRYRQRIRIKEQEMELEQERTRKEQRRKEAEKLRELDAMKTRFFTNISHEFRTPLTLILGQNERLQASVEDETLTPRFQMVDRNGHRLLDLVNQVLDVAKLEAGGMKLEPTTLDVIPYLKHLLYSFESMAEEKDIKLDFVSDLQKLDTAFDTQRMERVFFNLLSNAFKFTPAGGQVVMIVEAIGKSLIVKIQDTGVGIKSEQVPYLFDRFYQADSSENLAQPGTGIGLSLVKELVELHGGRVSATSELNQGTTFIIELPIPEELSEFKPAKEAIETTLTPESLPQRNISKTMEVSPNEGNSLSEVLLVEDNPDVRSYVRDQLIEFGYKVVEAVDGIDGLEKAQEHVPDLIISDIMMPRLDGYGVAKGLKKDERTSHIPVILLTSKASDESKVAGFESGIDDYLLKPFNSVELKARVANLIEQRKRLRQRFSSATIIRPNEVSVVPMDQVFLKKVLDTIEANLTNEQFGVDVLSAEIGMSSTHLNRKLRALVDQTAGKLIRSMRLQRAADLLSKQAATISEVAYDMGFSTLSHFTRSFKKQFGVSPSEYLKGEDGG